MVIAHTAATTLMKSLLLSSLVSSSSALNYTELSASDISGEILTEDYGRIMCEVLSCNPVEPSCMETYLTNFTGHGQILKTEERHRDDNFFDQPSTNQPTFCPRNWDEILCWPQTVEGGITTLPCLTELNGIQYRHDSE